MINVGLISGPRVSMALKEKIWNSDYVSFWELLNPVLDCPGEVQAPDTGKSKAKVLSGLQWHRAFLCFVAIRTEKFPQENDDLLRYGGFIGELMEQQVDWALYDSRFRWDKASDPTFHLYPWNHIRQQLVNEAHQSHLKKTQAGFSGQGTFRAAQELGIPAGYCFKHHDRNTGDCRSRACHFTHSCPKCGEKHPLYEHHHAQAHNKYSSPKHKKSSHSNKERRRR